MKVYALIGESGTGKSTTSIPLTKEHDIPAIIDDGLFIYKGKKIAGSSAKFEKTTVAAVKRAIFHDDEHAQSIKDAMNAYDFDRILVIGTSKRMVDRIVNRLEIGPIDHIFYIEDILSPEEIEKAKHERMTKGKHIIPVSYKQFDQNFIQKLIQKGIEIFTPHKEKIGEVTIVKPYFHRRLIAKIKDEKAKRQDKQSQKQTNKENDIYPAKRRFIYPVNTKEEIAKLVPVVMNYIEEQLVFIKEKVIKYYYVLKREAYELLLKWLEHLRQLIRFLIEQTETKYTLST